MGIGRRYRGASVVGLSRAVVEYNAGSIAGGGCEPRAVVTVGVQDGVGRSSGAASAGVFGGVGPGHVSGNTVRSILAGRSVLVLLLFPDCVEK